MPILFYILLVSFLISTAALIGIFSLLLKKHLLNRIVLFLVALAAGTLMGGAFLHLLPEASEQLSSRVLYPAVLVSFVLFFLIEKLFHWRHCHKGKCSVHTFGYINLLGDAVHNFVDGLIIAAAFLTSTKLGMITSIAVAFHEIPQEIGDFGVLVYAGFNKSRALFLNFLIALTVVIGGVVGYFLSLRVESLVSYLLPFAAGGFLYIATSDLIPEIKKEKEIKKSLLLFLYFLIGILLMCFIGFLG